MMRFFSMRGSAIVAIGLLAATAVTVSQAFAGGGLSVSPGVLEHVANPGGVGSMKISNTTGGPMAVKVAARPWLQASNGEVSPNRGRTFGEVSLDASSFTLAAGSSRTVGLSLSRSPSGRSLYGGIEVTGTPSGRSGGGIRVAYRVISSLRLDPPTGAQSFRAQAGRLVEQGTVGHGTLLLAVRNTGNTIVPIGGIAHISGSGHAQSGHAVAKVIVPGATVNVPLMQLLGSLPKGRYTVSTRLTQGGHGLGTFTGTVSLR